MKSNEIIWYKMVYYFTETTTNDKFKSITLNCADGTVFWIIH